MNVVLDTNIIVSGIGWDGPPRRILLALRAGQHSLATSPAHLEELTAVLRYPKLRVITSHPLVAVVLEWLHRPEHIVIPQERIDIIRADRGDNLVLEGAVAVGADAIVSGDRHLRALKQFRGIPILQAREFGAKHLWQVS